MNPANLVQPVFNMQVTALSLYFTTFTLTCDDDDDVENDTRILPLTLRRSTRGGRRLLAKLVTSQWLTLLLRFGGTDEPQRAARRRRRHWWTWTCPRTDHARCECVAFSSRTGVSAESCNSRKLYENLRHKNHNFPENATPQWPPKPSGTPRRTLPLLELDVAPNRCFVSFLDQDGLFTLRYTLMRRPTTMTFWVKWTFFITAVLSQF